MKTPLVSILIPAFRLRWLDLAVASALAQTVQDCEIIVSDDTASDDVARLLMKWDDPRIVYIKNPHRGLIGTNRDHLIAHARGKYLKFLFDDDVLLPKSCELLVQLIEQSHCGLAFHSRYVIDDDGKVGSAPSYLAKGEQRELTHQDFFVNMVGNCANLIGEPSNILIRSDILKSMPSPFTVQDRRMVFLTDVALYANFMTSGQGIIGTAQFGSAFRIHGDQTSGQSYAGFSAGVFEWEVIRRWSVGNGYLSDSQFIQGKSRQNQMYQQYAKNHPELLDFISINSRPSSTNHLDKEFTELLDLAYARIAIRQQLRRQADLVI